ncbi:CPBP family intramembrane metalloprotease [Muricauda oceani]|uniref:CPBP family intramembrane metalloprotease n=1 Tax=Flagellimonas oceani TaxID=2698672 RepID=A0A6G7J0R5_9FLAO|nr:type II CAAX endopeptidase family protein [Allomuricauda oceani]MBW8241619.1 CPBP family intramembrane metalloprotease [Allomuricauda oceani]QII44395.1 CPBP family intramembrane metalloprotease [Allomuricauda oceani]
MYIEQAYKGFTERWRYLVGFLIVFVGWQIVGGIPLLAAMLMKSDFLSSGVMDYGAIANTLGLNLFFFLVMLTFLAAMVSLWVVVKFIHRLSFKNFTTSRKKVDWKRIIFSFVLWGAISSGFVFLDIYLSPENYEFTFDAVPFFILLLLSIIFVPIQTSFEEYFTRGYLMQSIGIAAKNRWLPFLVSSSLFGLLHIFNPEVEKLGYGVLVFYIGTGFFLGILTLMDEGLELPLGFHAANNFFTALLVTADWMAFNTNSMYRDVSEPVLGWDILVPVFIIYPILLIIFAKIYGWNNWKEKLFGRVLSKEEFVALTDGESDLA